MKYFYLTIALLFSTAVQADTTICLGKVKAISIHKPNNLYVSVGDSELFKICSLQDTYNSTSPEGCKAIFSLISSAKAMQKDIKIYVDNAPTTSCSSITKWFSADVVYVEQQP